MQIEGLRATYWEGAPECQHAVHDIWGGGASIETGRPWLKGTLIRMALVWSTADGAATETFPSVWAEVKNSTADGMLVGFVFCDRAERAAFDEFMERLENKAARRPLKAARARGRSGGQALIEFALVLPLLFLLMVNALNFGGLLYAWVTVANAARTGAQFMVMGDAWVFGLTPPLAAQVSAVVTKDLVSLPNRGSATLQICVNISGTSTCNPAGGSAPTDPEPSSYNSASVLVSYTYQPFVRFWNFSRLGINLTTPPTAVQRKVTMRCAGGCGVA